MFHPVKIDLVDELRLRRWARMNYFPMAQRQASWHPVILDEMRVQDSEKKSALLGPKWLTHIPHILSTQTAAVASAADELYYN